MIFSYIQCLADRLPKPYHNTTYVEIAVKLPSNKIPAAKKGFYNDD